MFKPPVDNPKTYSVYVDDQDMVWITEWTSNAIMRFDPRTQKWMLLARTIECGASELKRRSPVAAQARQRGSKQGHS